MRSLAYALISGLLLCACGSSGDLPPPQPGPPPPPEPPLVVTGKVQKGPLVATSVGTVTSLGADLAPTGSPVPVTLTNVDQYSTPADPGARYVQVEFTGRFIDEFFVLPSFSPVTLRVIVPASAVARRDSINVNVLTTLTAARVRTLVAASPTTVDPLTTAENELLQWFPFSAAAGLPLAFHRFDQTGSSQADAFGFLVSLVVLETWHRVGGEFYEFLPRMEADFADDGQLDDPVVANALNVAIQNVDIARGSAGLIAAYAAAGRTVTAAPAQTLINRAPFTRAGANVMVTVGSSVALDAGASSDLDGDALTFAWVVVREQSDFPYFPDPPYESFALQGKTATFTPDRAATYLVVLTVTDSAGATGTDTLRVVARHEFVANGDGTVTNVQTGLVWQQVIIDGLHTLAEADGRIRASPGENPDNLNLCGNLVLAGHDDWRVPTNGEVRSLVDFSRSAPMINLAMFPDTRTDVPHISNSWRPNTSADFVYFSDGIIHHVSVGLRGMLRCVRS